MNGSSGKMQLINASRGERNMVTIGICDDEQQMRKTLRQILEQSLQLQGMEYQIFEYISGEELIAGTKVQDLDILFLDIEMSALDGIQTARLLRKKGMKTVIIFVTAYPEFVFQGYEVHAFHYILKPYKEKKITQVMEQALKEMNLSKVHYFMVEQKSKLVRIPLDRTVAFCSERRKICVIMKEESIEFYGKLNEVETSLPEYFIRIHNRYIVNLNFVTTLEKDCCILGKHSFPVSRTYRQNLEVAFARAMLR